ncbi:hypothetical protein NHX12_025066, partial [Muraenolepis orangiensis]
MSSRLVTSDSMQTSSMETATQQLARHKSHESTVRSVVEKGEALLDTVQDPTVPDNMKRLQADYQDLCSAVK